MKRAISPDHFYGKDPSAAHENENHPHGKDPGICGSRFARFPDHHSAILYDMSVAQRHIHILHILGPHDDLRHGTLYARR